MQNRSDAKCNNSFDLDPYYTDYYDRAPENFIHVTITSLEKLVSGCDRFFCSFIRLSDCPKQTCCTRTYKFRTYVHQRKRIGAMEA
jgi:hypothetical protein